MWSTKTIGEPGLNADEWEIATVKHDWDARDRVVRSCDPPDERGGWTLIDFKVIEYACLFLWARRKT